MSSWLQEYRKIRSEISNEMSKIEPFKADADADNEKHAAVLNKIIAEYRRDLEASVRASFIARIIASGKLSDITRNLALDHTFEDLLGTVDEIHAAWHKKHGNMNPRSWKF